MPWDSVDKPRDEDMTERRKKSRRRFFLGGRRSNDNALVAQRKEREFPKLEVAGSNPVEGAEDAWKKIYVECQVCGHLTGKIHATCVNCGATVKYQCACKKCCELVSPDDYTFPDCVNCFQNLDGVCEW